MTQVEGRCLTGKTVIVTGGYTFLGKGIALGFARAGADLGIIARTHAKLETAAEEIRACGVQALSLVADITNEQQVVEAFEQAADKFGHIDVLVNNVGVRPDGRMRVQDMDLGTWNEIIACNLTGAMLCSREAVRHMLVQGNGGAIVNIGSLAGKQGSPGLAHYSASKAGLLSLTQALAQEVGHQRIRSNYIALGIAEGPRTDRGLAVMAKLKGITPEEELAQRVEKSALGRVVRLQELVDLVLFLASDASSGMTGQGINLSAGSAFH